MTDRPSAAGGFFLILAILFGFGLGVWQGQQLLGSIAGTLVGIAIAIWIWLRDRNRIR